MFLGPQLSSIACLFFYLCSHLLPKFVHGLCVPQLELHIYRCTHAQLNEIPSIVHAATSELDLSHNLIEVLHEDSFTRFSNLRKLILRHNRIYKITDRAFLPLAKSLEVLDLRGNQLFSSPVVPFPVSALSSLGRLRELDLSENPIGLLPRGLLRFVAVNLTHFRLSSSLVNLLLDDGAFLGMNQLHHLDLSGNTLVQFTRESFIGLNPGSLSHLKLSGVQWNCNCEILWFRKWLNRVPRKALSDDKYPGGECVTPPKLRHHPLLSVGITEFQCRPKILTTIPPSELTEINKPIPVIGFRGFNLTLSCTFIAEPIPTTKWYHNDLAIQQHGKRILSVNRSDIRYITTLQLRHLDHSADSGLYECKALNQLGEASVWFKVSVTKANAFDDLHSLDSGQEQTFETRKGWFLSNFPGKYLVIAGVIITANLVVVLLGASTYFLVKYRRRIRDEHLKNNGKHCISLISNHKAFESTSANSYQSHLGAIMIRRQPTSTHEQRALTSPRSPAWFAQSLKGDDLRLSRDSDRSTVEMKTLLSHKSSRVYTLTFQRGDGDCKKLVYVPSDEVQSNSCTTSEVASSGNKPTESELLDTCPIHGVQLNLDACCPLHGDSKSRSDKSMRTLDRNFQTRKDLSLGKGDISKFDGNVFRNKHANLTDNEFCPTCPFDQ